jgi:hypothetical protein
MAPSKRHLTLVLSCRRFPERRHTEGRATGNTKRDLYEIGADGGKSRAVAFQGVQPPLIRVIQFAAMDCLGNLFRKEKQKTLLTWS